jgi:arginine repressor
MARKALPIEQQQRTLHAKQILRILWKKSGLKQQDILAELTQRHLEIKKNTLSNWLSDTEVTYSHH